MRSRLRLAPAVILAAACGNVVDAPPPPDRQPLLELMLVAGRDSATARIAWLTPGGADPAPVATGDVTLTVTDGAGVSAKLIPTGVPGAFGLRLPIVAGGSYRLEGTIGGTTVSAATVVPAAFSVQSPAGEHLTLTPDGTGPAGPFAVVPLRWSGSGVAVLAADSAFILPSAHYTRATEADLVVAGRRIRLVGMNRDLDGYLFGVPAPATNLAGAFGVFGGAVEVVKEVVWR